MSGRIPPAPAPHETEEQRLARLDRVAGQLSRARRSSRTMSRRYHSDLNDAAAKQAAASEEKQ